MTLDELRSREHVSGIKQCAKALKRNDVTALFLANDAQERTIAALRMAAEEQCVPILDGGTMQELGKSSGIPVGAAAVAVLE